MKKGAEPGSAPLLQLGDRCLPALLPAVRRVLAPASEHSQHDSRKEGEGDDGSKHVEPHPDLHGASSTGRTGDSGPARAAPGPGIYGRFAGVPRKIGRDL